MNSLKHGFHDLQEGIINICITPNDREVTVIYSDSGNGIAPENLQKIFDPFLTTKRGQGGSGLGMHIVYNLVTQTLGGTIICSSEIDKGAQFQLELPIAVNETQ